MRWISDEGVVHDEIIHFQKSTDLYGDLGNMTGGYPLRVAGVHVRTAEALYQACRYPCEPTWQREIIDENSPMMCKRVAHKKERKDRTRLDWERVNVSIMRWVLRVKLCQHLARFRGLLRSTKEQAIVELSRRDRFWGAVEQDAETLVGTNRLGQLWMELRQELVTRPEEELLVVQPLDIPDFLLCGQPIGVVKK